MSWAAGEDGLGQVDMSAVGWGRRIGTPQGATSLSPRPDQRCPIACGLIDADWVVRSEASGASA